MAALKDEVKLYIVNALACFDSPTQVSIAVKEEFGLDVPRQQVSLYDPNTYVGRNLSQKWRTIFEETRTKFRATAEEIPIASKAFRLRGLGRLAQKARTCGTCRWWPASMSSRQGGGRHLREQGQGRAGRPGAHTCRHYLRRERRQAP